MDDKHNRNFLWATADGQVLRIRDMEDKHLKNAIRYLRKIACKDYMRERGREYGLKPQDFYQDTYYILVAERDFRENTREETSPSSTTSVHKSDVVVDRIIEI